MHTLLIEMFLLFMIVPFLFAFMLLPWLILVILCLLAFTWCLGILLFDNTFDRKQLWNRAALRPHLKRILITYAIACTTVLAGIFFYDRKFLFLLARERPMMWVLLMVLYPLCSVYPQEIVYRAFFFHRYKRVFPHQLMMIGASALAFSSMHIIFQNFTAVLLTLAGGILFAKTYNDTRSTLAASFEHALYGCFVFTAGLYPFFFRSDTSMTVLLDAVLKGSQ